MLWQRIMNPKIYARVELERVHCRQSILTRAFSLVGSGLVATESSQAGLIPLPGFSLSATPNGSEWYFQICPFLARVTQRIVSGIARPVPPRAISFGGVV